MGGFDVAGTILSDAERTPPPTVFGRHRGKERFAYEEPVPASLARSCPRSFDFARVARFAQDDTAVLNFFEEVALSVRLGQSDEETVSEAFAGLVLRSYRTYRAWFEENRDTTGRQKMWKELENLAEKWAKR